MAERLARKKAEAKLAEALAGKASTEYEAGAVVQLLGLKSEMQYNGQTAEVICASRHRGRYEIKMSDGSEKTVRSENVRPVGGGGSKPSPAKAKEFIIHSGVELWAEDAPAMFPPKIGTTVSGVSNASVISIPVEECYSSSDASSVSLFDRPAGHMHSPGAHTPPLQLLAVGTAKGEKKEKKDKK